MAKADDFVGRQEDMHNIAKLLLNNRLITVRGLPGIGKTSISKRLGFFISERELFKDGVIYLSMRGKNQTNSLIEAIYQYFVRVQPKDFKSEDNGGKPLSNQSIMERKIFETLSNTDTLLIIDNLEEVLYRDEHNLKEFLKNILERLPHLKILTTSRESIGNLDEIRENVYNLN